MNNQWWKIRPQVVNINSDNTFFYTYSIEVNKCGGSFNNINNPYSKFYVPNAVKNINVEVFNLVSRINEARCKEQHKKFVSANVDYMQVFVMRKDVGTKINKDVNAKN